MPLQRSTASAAIPEIKVYVASQPAVVAAVVQHYESVFISSATVNIDVGFGEIDGVALNSGNVSESKTYIGPPPTLS